MPEKKRSTIIFPNTGQTSVLYPYWLTFFYFLTNLSPIALSILFFTPQYCKSRILEDSTDNCIVVPTIAL